MALTNLPPSPRSPKNLGAQVVNYAQIHVAMGKISADVCTLSSPIAKSDLFISVTVNLTDRRLSKTSVCVLCNRPPGDG